MIRWLLANWQLKLVALFLAVALWLYTSGQARVPRPGVAVRVPVAAVTLHPGYQVSAISPGEFTVDLDGPLSVVNRVKPSIDVPALAISAEALARGEQTFPITTRLLGLDPDLHITGLPEGITGITVRFGRVVEDHVPVELPRLADVPANLEPTLSLDRTQVRVRGPRPEIDRLKSARLRFLPIGLGTVDPRTADEAVQIIGLQPELPASVQALEEVTATVRLRPLLAAQQTVALPVHLLMPRESARRFEVELSQTQVALTVRGPKNLLADLRPEDLTAYVNLRRALEPNVAHELPVQILAPAWLTCDPATVRCTLTLAPALTK